MAAPASAGGPPGRAGADGRLTRTSPRPLGPPSSQDPKPRLRVSRTDNSVRAPADQGQGPPSLLAPPLSPGPGTVTQGPSPQRGVPHLSHGGGRSAGPREPSSRPVSPMGLTCLSCVTGHPVCQSARGDEGSTVRCTSRGVQASPWGCGCTWQERPGPRGLFPRQANPGEALSKDGNPRNGCPADPGPSARGLGPNVPRDVGASFPVEKNHRPAPVSLACAQLSPVPPRSALTCTLAPHPGVMARPPGHTETPGPRGPLHRSLF